MRGGVSTTNPEPPANWPSVGEWVEWNDGERWLRAKVTAVFRNDVQLVVHGTRAVLTDRSFVRPVDPHQENPE